MGCLYQTFKIVIIILILVNIGTGYTKFYQLLVDIVDKVGELKNIRSAKDLIWILFLVVQVSSTTFQFIQLYCLFRELCENNFMYKHCFKCCFILTLLIYLISVIPKSIITIIYYNYSSSISNWWKSVTDFFDGLLSGVTSLGFQIILFMPVILRTCRSAGMCRRKISPINTKSDDVDHDLEAEKEDSKCCFPACCVSKRKNENSVDAVTEKTKSNSRTERVKGKAKHTVNKGIKMKSKVENKKKQMEAKVTHIKEKHTEKFEKKVEDGKKRIKSKVVKPPKKTGRDLYDKFDDDEEQSGKKNKGGVMICLTSCKSKACLCLANRTTRCFIISMALANFHLLVYVVEVVFVLCFVC